MKYLSKLSFVLAVIISFTACKKLDQVPFSPNGQAVTLNASTTSVTTAPADSANQVISFSWSNPKYAQDSSLYKYVIEIDSTGRNFSKEYKLTVSGDRDTTLTGKQFNNILAALGVVPGVAGSVEVRVTSSYANNNEAYQSNVVTIATTPYIVPITVTASTAGPLTLAIANAANSAIKLDWNATQYGNLPFTYAIQVDTAGGDFSNPQIISTGNNFSKDITVGELNTIALQAGVGANSSKDLAMRVVAFQGTNTVPSVISNVITVNVSTYLPFLYLYLPGDYQGWSPDVAPRIGATVPDLNYYEGYVYVPAGGSYEFKITNAPDWNHTAYGGDATTLSATGPNLKWPSGAGYYLVKANPATMAWSATKTDWGIIGDATPGGWDNSTPMIYDATNKVWVINSVPLSAKAMKFRANNGWDLNLGGNLSVLNYGGDNISVSEAGNYKIVLDLSNPLKYKATLTKL